MLKKLFLVIIFLQLIFSSVALAATCDPPCSGTDVCQLVPAGDPRNPDDYQCFPTGGGGGGGGGGGAISTDIETLAKDFFAYQTLDKFIYNLFQIGLVLGAIAAFLFLIWGAIDYIISGGNQERVKTAKTMIGNALAGLAILAAAWVIWRLVAYFLGLSSTLKGPFKINLPTP